MHKTFIAHGSAGCIVSQEQVLKRGELLFCKLNPSIAVQTEPLYCCADRTPLLLCKHNPSTAVQAKTLYCCADKTPLLLCRLNSFTAVQAKPPYTHADRTLYTCAG